ncbi:MAG: hypothetical protein NTV68_15640 [Methanomicrobiales archaeon]|nr:hypothetical protein [Methanomicrobiales archaeon]
MVDYNPGPEIIEASSVELHKIVSWINTDPALPQNAVLIGGWAVDVYNSYFGSVDIDLVVEYTASQLLIEHLKIHEGYVTKIRYPFDTVKKDTQHGEIILDLISHEGPYGYEGHPEVPFTWDILTGNTVFRNVRGGAKIQVPNRSVLVLLKLKAAWDRTYRILHQTSLETGYEGHKRVKDCADILALIDPVRGGREIDLEILGTLISRADFLKENILQIPDIDAVRDRYQLMTEQEIRRVCEDFVSIL